MNIFVMYIGWIVLGCAGILLAAGLIGVSILLAKWFILRRWKTLQTVRPAIWLHEAAQHYAKIKRLPPNTRLVADSTFSLPPRVE